MKKIIFIVIFLLVGIYQTRAESEICTLTSGYTTISINQNTAGTGGYFTVLTPYVSGWGPYINTYDIKTCELIDSTYILWGNSTLIPWIFNTPYSEIVFFRGDENTYIMAFSIDKNSGIITPIIRQSTYSPNWEYKILSDSIRINGGNGGTNCISPINISLTGNTITCGVDTETSIKSIDGKYNKCYYLDTVSSCFYKPVTNSGIYYLLSDNNINHLIEDDGISNWFLYYMSGYDYLIGDFGSTVNNSIEYNTVLGTVNTLTGQLISNIYKSGSINYNAYVSIPYSNTDGFPEYDFNNDGLPLIFTDYSSLLSYYSRDNVYYSNNTGATLGNILDLTGTGGTGTGTFGTGILSLDYDCDTDSSGDIGIGEALYCPIVVIGAFYNKIMSGIDTLYNFIIKIKEVSPDLNTFFISKVNAVDMTGVADLLSGLSNKESMPIDSVKDRTTMLKWGIIFIFVAIFILLAFG